MPTLVQRAQSYLHETLGITTFPGRVWPGQDALPYYLRDAFEFQEVDFQGTPILLAVERDPTAPPVSEIRTRLDKLLTISALPTVYVTNALASYERKRLIEGKVPFIVPGNQLYLPDLGIDLREYFRQRPAAAGSPLSPAAQAMLIAVLLRPQWEREWHPKQAAASLGYTLMTVSRCVRELVAAGLAEAHKVGRTQHLVMLSSPQVTWERAAPLLRSPVLRTVWTFGSVPEQLPAPLAGLSALARRTMLVEPTAPVYAIARTTWHALNGKVEELPEPRPGATEWQLWSYSPSLGSGSEIVDPLSLILSLRGSGDDRIQGALDDLKKQLPW